jgi:succinate dehydrogenase / fumarate reductase membrane anchor subunit
MVWFIFNLISVFDKDYIEVVSFFSKQPSKLLVSLLLIFAYFFSALSISEVFEDYIQDEKFKNVANKALNIFAIIMPLITIIILFNLTV